MITQKVTHFKLYTNHAMVFPGIMYRCECWAIKKTEHPRIDAFELWYYI